MPTRAERSPDRLVMFSDAVVAIAVTLLILPLADAVPEAVEKHIGSVELVAENKWKIFAFLLSFAVILRLWVVHHRVFEHLKAFNRPIMLANFCWLLAIVVIPFPTEMVSGYADDRFTAAIYVETIMVACLCQLAMIFITRGRPDLAQEDDGSFDRMFFGAVVAAAALVVAFVLVALVPGIGYWPMLLLVLNGPLERLRERRLATVRA